MKLCAHCHGRLGLGVRFENYFVSVVFGWAHKRFCSQRCNDLFNASLKEARRLLPFRAWLYQQPP